MPTQAARDAPGDNMRKFLQIPFFMTVALASVLAIAACGSDGDGGGGGQAGAGGSGGTGGIGGEAGGEGGTGGVEMSPECEAMCETFDACKIEVTTPDGVIPCPDYCGSFRQPRIIECLTNVTCAEGDDIQAQADACGTYVPCDTACNHVFSECSLEQSPISSNGKPWDLDTCLDACPFQPWSDAAIDCMAAAECTTSAVVACLQ